MDIKKIATKYECNENSDYWYNFADKSNARDFMSEIYNQLNIMAYIRTVHGLHCVHLIDKVTDDCTKYNPSGESFTDDYEAAMDDKINMYRNEH